MWPCFRFSSKVLDSENDTLRSTVASSSSAPAYQSHVKRVKCSNRFEWILHLTYAL